MGYDKMKCRFVPFSMDVLYLNCPYGKIASLTTNGVGINSYVNKVRDACLVEEKFKNELCSSAINIEEFTNYFNSNCKDK